MPTPSNNRKMKTQFELLKNGCVATTVWANPTKREIYPANRNSFGYNAEYHFGDEFYNKYGKDLKVNPGKVARGLFYSARSMESVGFQLVMRGKLPLW